METGNCIKCGRPDTAVAAIFNGKAQFICDVCLAPGGITGTEIVAHGTSGVPLKEYTASGYKSAGFENHWGCMVDLSKPTTGVVSLNAPEWIDDAICNGIDLAWEDHVAECEGRCAGCHCNHAGPRIGDDEHSKCQCYGKERHAYDPIDDHDGCGPEERGTVLIGSWKKVDDKYEPDPNAEGAEYAAMVGEMYVQVVWSRNVVRVRSLCSPCYPGQADVDPDKIVKDGEPGYLAYDLPAEMYGETR